MTKKRIPSFADWFHPIVLFEGPPPPVFYPKTQEEMDRIMEEGRQEAHEIAEASRAAMTTLVEDTAEMEERNKQNLNLWD